MRDLWRCAARPHHHADDPYRPEQAVSMRDEQTRRAGTIEQTRRAGR